MKLVLFSLLVLLGAAQLAFPYACDCWEHTNEDSCAAHKCKWDTSIKTDRKCRVKACNERDKEVAACVAPSQFYSTNRTACYPSVPLGESKEVCTPIQTCEDLDVSKIGQSYARRVCKVNFCGYDNKSKGCKTVKYCEQITTQEECNSFFINELPSLFQPKAYCFWAGDVCMQSTRFFGECENRNIKDKLLCKAHGCQWKQNLCQNLNCTTITTDLCKKEHMDSFGKIHVCELKNDKCLPIPSNQIRKEDCDKMIAHTFDAKTEICKPCASLSKYLLMQVPAIEVGSQRLAVATLLALIFLFM